MLEPNIKKALEAIHAILDVYVTSLGDGASPELRTCLANLGEVSRLQAAPVAQDYAGHLAGS